MESVEIKGLLALHKHIKGLSKRSAILASQISQAKQEKKVSLKELLAEAESLSKGLAEHVVLFGHLLNQHEKKRQTKEAIMTKAKQMQNLLQQIESLKQEEE